MSTFIVACLHNVNMGAEIIEYLERIDRTLGPFGGHFLVHGGPIERLEGNWSGDLVILQFPDREKARAWYRSSAYQSIVELRRSNSEGDVMLIETVPRGHRATDVLTLSEGNDRI